MYDFCVVGAGIFGVTTAIELRKAGYSVVLLNHGQIPDPLAASTDISKIVRMEYGSDAFYLKCADKCIDTWLEWNDLFGETLYHQTGFLLLSNEIIDRSSGSFESACFHCLIKNGFTPERLTPGQLAQRFPAFKTSTYVDGFFHARAGYAESGRALELLADYASSIDVDLHEWTPVVELLPEGSEVRSIRTVNGNIQAGHFIIAAGSATRQLVKETRDMLRGTGHPVFHLAPGGEDEMLFRAPQMPVFAADIANSGWYGFPLHPRAGVVKVANHGVGEHMPSFESDRLVREDERSALNSFLQGSIPALSKWKVVYERKCVYTDTKDGHFLIDNHPDFQNLTVATGGSGHGFKMGPMLGKWISEIATDASADLPERFKWRVFNENVKFAEEARRTHDER